MNQQEHINAYMRKHVKTASSRDNTRLGAKMTSEEAEASVDAAWTLYSSPLKTTERLLAHKGGRYWISSDKRKVRIYDSIRFCDDTLIEWYFDCKTGTWHENTGEVLEAHVIARIIEMINARPSKYQFEDHNI